MRWYVCSSRTGAVISKLTTPNEWEITEPLREASSGTVKIPLPQDTARRDRLRALLRPDPIRPYSRAIAMEDDEGRMIFGGPMYPSRPYREGENVVIQVVDWRSWFYSAEIRPLGSKLTTPRHYIQSAREQCLMMWDLAGIALENVAGGAGHPRIVRDTPPDSNINRKLTAYMLQDQIGNWLDTVRNFERGPEWWTYVTKDSDTQITPHFAVAWPERRTLTYPLRLIYREGDRGNVTGYDFPAGAPAPTRVYAYDGQDKPVVFTHATEPTVAATVDVLWESKITLTDEKVTKAQAFDRAYEQLRQSTGYDGPLTLTVLHEKVPIGSYQVGDRARVILDDHWESLKLDSARIVQRVISGGTGKPTQSVITIDINDRRYPDDGSTPGKVAG